MAVLVKMLSPRILKIVNLEIPEPAPDIAILKTAGEYMKEKLTKSSAFALGHLDV
jgi:hypothetical protein